jgi:hypothetical protein
MDGAMKELEIENEPSIDIAFPRLFGFIKPPQCFPCYVGLFLNGVLVV